MKLVKYQGRSPECLEGFPTDTERSVKGALHLRPGRTLEITDDEYAYVKANRPDLMRSLVVLRELPGKQPEAPASEE